MDFRDMTYVLAIGKYGNLTKAAEALYISQPNLSRFLQALEKSIGQPLFKRVGNKYVPTYIGERYMDHARRILQDKQELDQEMTDIIQNDRGELRIGFPMMRGTHMLPCTLPVFRRVFPNVSIRVREANTGELNRLLQEGEIDLAFYNKYEENANFEYIPISHEELLMVTSTKHELVNAAVTMEGCSYPHMDLQLLKDHGVLVQRQGQQTRRIMDRMMKKAGVVPNIVLESSNIPALAELAARGYGIAFITETHLKHLNLRNELRCFSVGDPTTPVDFVAVHRKNGYLPRFAQEYIDIVKDFT